MTFVFLEWNIMSENKQDIKESQLKDIEDKFNIKADYLNNNVRCPSNLNSLIVNLKNEILKQYTNEYLTYNDCIYIAETTSDFIKKLLTENLDIQAIKKEIESYEKNVSTVYNNKYINRVIGATVFGAVLGFIVFASAGFLIAGSSGALYGIIAGVFCGGIVSYRLESKTSMLLFKRNIKAANDLRDCFLKDESTEPQPQP